MGSIFSTEDFNVGVRIEGAVGLNEVSGKVGFLSVIFGPIGNIFMERGFKGSLQNLLLKA